MRKTLSHLVLLGELKVHPHVGVACRCGAVRGPIEGARPARHEGRLLRERGDAEIVVHEDEEAQWLLILKPARCHEPPALRLDEVVEPAGKGDGALLDVVRRGLRAVLPRPPARPRALAEDAPKQDARVGVAAPPVLVQARRVRDRLERRAGGPLWHHVAVGGGGRDPIEPDRLCRDQLRQIQRALPEPIRSRRERLHDHIRLPKLDVPGSLHPLAHRVVHGDPLASRMQRLVRVRRLALAQLKDLRRLHRRLARRSVLPGGKLASEELRRRIAKRPQLQTRGLHDYERHGRDRLERKLPRNRRGSGERVRRSARWTLEAGPYEFRRRLLHQLLYADDYPLGGADPPLPPFLPLCADVQHHGTVQHSATCGCDACVFL